MSAKSRLSTMLFMGAMLHAGAQTSQKEFENESNIKPKKPIIPSGCKEYHFTRSGRFDTTENMWNDIDYIFSCIASNSKNAVKKFNKFQSQQNGRIKI